MLITVCRSYEVSDMLEQVAEEEDRQTGYDIADYFIHRRQVEESKSPGSIISTEKTVDSQLEPTIENPSNPKPLVEQLPNEDAKFWKNFHQYQHNNRKSCPKAGATKLLPMAIPFCSTPMIYRPPGT